MRIPSNKSNPHKNTVDPALLENEDENQEEIRAALRERFDEYVEEAIESMLDFYEKMTHLIHAQK